MRRPKQSNVIIKLSLSEVVWLGQKVESLKEPAREPVKSLAQLFWCKEVKVYSLW